jgi:ornithine carbamoyltransferase
MTVTTLKPKHAHLTLARTDLLSIQDLSPAETLHILEMTRQIKSRPQEFALSLAGKHLVMMFEKPSLRTRLTFEVGITSMGGHVTFIDSQGARIDARESLADIARNLERWVSGIVLRTFSHRTITDMAAHARVPVINALSDLEHPCQALTDYFTLFERVGDLCAVKLAYVGDGNNVAHSLILTAAQLGSHIAVATPVGFEPQAAIVAKARAIARKTGATIEVTTDCAAAVTDANAVYTDIWTSMGQESEASARHAHFLPYQVNAQLMKHAAPSALFMHCLPAHRGYEVTNDVIDGPCSVVFDAAENRMHVQKAIMALLLGGDHPYV